MPKAMIVLFVAVLCGCSGPQVKDTAVRVSSALIRGAAETREVDRRVERCKADQPGTAVNCNREQARVDYWIDADAGVLQRARDERRASKQQREYFVQTFDPDADEAAELSTAQEHQRQNALIESLSDDLSETLAD